MSDETPDTQSPLTAGWALVKALAAFVASLFGLFKKGPGSAVRSLFLWALDKAATAVLTAALVGLLLGHLALPSGCSLPIPIPPAPAPQNPLAASLQAAYAKDADATKAAKLAALADYYGAVTAAAHADPTVTTLSNLQAKIHLGADVVAGQGGMANLRGVVSSYVAQKLPAEDAPMTDALWSAASGAYADLSEALKQVKK